MPKKRGTPSAKKMRQYEKQFLLDMAKEFVQFFNQDLFEHFSKQSASKDDFEKFRSDPKAQEKLRNSFKHVIETMKAMIVAYEEFSGSKSEANLKALKHASDQLNSLKSLLLKFDLGVRNDGFIDTSAASAWMAEMGAVDEYGGKSAANRIGTWIENFKQDLARYKDNYSIGVCRYDRCRIFFVKKRKDQRYCKSSHKKLSWQEISRREERLRK